MNPGPKDTLDQASLLPARWMPVKFQRPVVLLGWTSTGQEMTAHATAIVVGAEGCIVRTQQPLRFHERVVLCCESKEIEGQLHVSEPLDRNYAADTVGRVQYIMRFDHPDPHFWSVHLEPMAPHHKLLFECSACNFRISSDLGVDDAMIFAADSIVILQCPTCRLNTRFRLADEESDQLEVKQDPNLVPSGYEIYTFRPGKKETNERAHRRVTTKTKAFLKIEGRDGDLVDVLDISRGGLRFESYANYEKGTELDIALHYVEGGNNIFQRAKIMRKQRRPTSLLPGEYGVMFVGGTKVG